MGAEKDVLAEIIQRGLPKSEVEAQRMLDALEGKKEDQEEAPEPKAQQAAPRSRSS